jgi:hypothetical protein
VPGGTTAFEQTTSKHADVHVDLGQHAEALRLQRIPDTGNSLGKRSRRADCDAVIHLSPLTISAQHLPLPARAFLAG